MWIYIGHPPSQGGGGFLKFPSGRNMLKGPVLPGWFINAYQYFHTMHIPPHQLDDIGRFFQVYQSGGWGVKVKRYQVQWRRVGIFREKDIWHWCPCICIRISQEEEAYFSLDGELSDGLPEITLEEHADK